MSRIRSIKPEFFRHEGLQDLESANPGQHVMLVFAGLWTLSDKLGRFEWKPRSIKLDILPFLDFDIETTLMLLDRFSLIRKYESRGKCYGLVMEFTKHQRVNGKEAQEPAKYPEPIDFIEGKHEGSSGEATGKQSRSQEGKGREGEMEGKGNGRDLAKSSSPIRPRKTITESKTAEIWRRYSTAYADRYHVEPVRNAKVNGQLAGIVDRIGAEEAPLVAEWYLAHNDRWYAQKGHSLDCLLKDAEKIRMEWATGNRITATKSTQMDRTQANGDVFAKLIAESEAATKTRLNNGN